jgi:hypothetical protein
MSLRIYRAIFTVMDAWGQGHTAGGEWVYEPEPGPIKTGLVDSNGTPIYRFPEERRIGFVLKREAAR